MKPKALVLLSGGLDSRLAVKLLQQQLGKNVSAVYIKLPFGTRYSKNFESLKEFCKKEKVSLYVIDCTKGRLLQDYLKIVRNPKYKRGSALNPCIDCHIFMLKLAKKLAKKIGADVIATGEVLGQRPMSQHRSALDLIEKEAGLRGRLLRPLSAKLLPQTIAEKEGWIKRNKLCGIRGRSRQKQLELAKKFKISFPSPGGGCLLCEKEFCKKVGPLLKKLSELDIELLKIGRHFKKSAIVLGKNHEENLKLKQIHDRFRKGFLLEPKEPGPSAFVKSKVHISEAKRLIQKYSKHKIRTITIK
ncbi:MAG: 7-cyano-7-deazaguanine synthase [Candidatus Nanoarchaeia archaeon]